jgi:hypothetical protein
MARQQPNKKKASAGKKSALKKKNAPKKKAVSKKKAAPKRLLGGRYRGFCKIHNCPHDTDWTTWAVVDAENKKHERDFPSHITDYKVKSR